MTNNEVVQIRVLQSPFTLSSSCIISSQVSTLGVIDESINNKPGKAFVISLERILHSLYLKMNELSLSLRFVVGVRTKLGKRIKVLALALVVGRLRTACRAVSHESGNITGLLSYGFGDSSFTT